MQHPLQALDPAASSAEREKYSPIDDSTLTELIVPNGSGGSSILAQGDSLRRREREEVRPDSHKR